MIRLRQSDLRAKGKTYFDRRKLLENERAMRTELMLLVDRLAQVVGTPQAEYDRRAVREGGADADPMIRWCLDEVVRRATAPAAPNVWDLDTNTGYHVKEEIGVVEMELGLGSTTLRGATDLLNAIARIGLRVRAARQAYLTIFKQIKEIAEVDMKLAGQAKPGVPQDGPEAMADYLVAIRDVHCATKAQRDDAVTENIKLRTKVSALERAVRSLNAAAELQADALREVEHAGQN